MSDAPEESSSDHTDPASTPTPQALLLRRAMGARHSREPRTRPTRSAMVLFVAEEEVVTESDDQDYQVMEDSGSGTEEESDSGSDDSDAVEWMEDAETDEGSEEPFAATNRRRSRQPAEPLPPPPPLDNDIVLSVEVSTAAENLRKPYQLRGAKCARSKGGARVMNTALMLRQRECDLAFTGHFSRAQQCHMAGLHYQPNRPVKRVDLMRSRAYIGQFSRQGDIFVAAFQQKKVKLYEADNNWRVRKDVYARNLRWTVTDTCISPDQQSLLYSTISPEVNLVNVGRNSGGAYSEANVTDVHECLHFDMMEGDDGDSYHTRHGGFGIWSLRWSPDGNEIIAGTGDNSLYVYDMYKQRSTLRIEGHTEDVNAVAFVDDSPNLVVTGADDNMIKLWDRRALGSSQRPAGLFVGHTEGITHIDPKGDGRYFISNCKDQSIKLWDLRCMLSHGQFRSLPQARYPKFPGWDYRWDEYPARSRPIRHPHDHSIMTYRGHAVLHTLIRAYFSPVHSTGQRFIYAGSQDGSVYIWDLVTAKVVNVLSYHHEIVRDCSWHPYDPLLVTTAFDGTVVAWEYQDPHQEIKPKGLPAPSYDQYTGFY
ncbi:hypothetical protein WJX72_007006 [[Myrmecia] bisecta]|uniref:Uncharacterized protein n=1 Tax=[Myrmecia] bisecta TaxID=41462 RepID=A0AAW1PK35_9CHLO